MSTGAEYVNILAKRVLGTGDFGSRMLDYLKDRVQESTAATIDAEAFMRAGVSFATDGVDNFQLSNDASNSLGNDGDFAGLNAVVWQTQQARARASSRLMRATFQ